MDLVQQIKVEHGKGIIGDKRALNKKGRTLISNKEMPPPSREYLIKLTIEKLTNDMFRDAKKIIKLVKIKKGKIKNFCKPIDQTMALMHQSKFYIGNDAGNAHLSLACGLKTYIIHGGSPPYSHTVYKNYYPNKFLNNLKPILPPDGVIRNPYLRTIDTVPQEKGMDLIKPEYVVKKILKK